MKKILLTSAAVLAAFTASSKVSANPVNEPALVSHHVARHVAVQSDGSTPTIDSLYAQDRDNLGMRIQLMDKDGHAVMLDGKPVYVTLKTNEKRKVVVETKRGAYQLEVQEKDGKATLLDDPQLLHNVTPEKPRTGWVQGKDGKWQYLRGGEALPAGWANLEGKWYFFDPEHNLKMSGWEFINGKWYYLNPTSGAMETGWLKDGGNWYYLNSSGAMETGWLKDGGNWYYLDKSGVMQSNKWIQVSGKWYFVDPSGKLLTNTNVDGYYVNANGEWYA